MEEDVGLLRLVSSNDFGWFDVNLFASDRLSQLDQLDQECNLCLFLCDGFGVKLSTIKETLTIASGTTGSCEDIMQVPEGWLGQELLTHLWFLEKLLVHLGSLLPILVAHFKLGLI